MKGVVHEAAGGVYRVVLVDGVQVEASLRGRVKQEQRTGNQVVIGDVVTVDRVDDAWTIESVSERTAELVRRGRGGRAAKLVAANLDMAFAVVAAQAPQATVELVDRLLVLGESSGMHPLLVVNKVDLPGADAVAAHLAKVYEPIGYRVLPVSAESGEGIDEFRTQLCSGTSTLMGPSGVGKSSLLNKIDPGLMLRTGGLSRKTGTGRHTTVGSRLIPLTCGGLVADTPGFGDVALWGVGPEDIETCFPEFAAEVDACRFRRCSHIHEPVCGVRAAVAEGRIVESRYQSYITARREAEDAEA